MPLGLLEAREYEEVKFRAQPGDAMVLYSDGITDHVNAAGEEFGRGRLAHHVRASCKKSAAEITDTIFREIDRFSLSAFDDQTVFVLKVL